MSENDNEELDSKNQSTEEVEKTDEIEETDDQSGTEDLETLQEKNKKLFERAKKAEAEAKLLKAERLKKEEQAKVKVEAKAKTESSEKQDVQLTQFDTIALVKANVTEKEDIEFATEYAKFKNISVAEALKSSVVKSELAERSETRATAEATNTGNARRGTTKLTPEQIVENANKGKLPDDPEALAEAHIAAKFNKK